MNNKSSFNKKNKKKLILHRFWDNQCRILTILRRSRVRDRLRILNILHRFSNNRCRMLSILRQSLIHGRLRMIIILHRSSQNRCKMFNILRMARTTTVETRCRMARITDVESLIYSSVDYLASTLLVYLLK